MNFDFHQQYKNYSNIELLKITGRPEDYQPAAVAVAAEILSERHVTADEIQIVGQYFENLDESASVRKEKADALKGEATDFLEPFLHPGEKVQPGKWVNILLAASSIQYAWSLIQTARYIIAILRCDYCRKLDIIFITQILSLIYVPLILFLLFKRRRWGWILLFADNLFILISRICQSYIFFKYQSIHRGSTSSYLSVMFIKAAFVVFLWREPIANYFGITTELKKRTALVTTAGTLLFFLVTYLVVNVIEI